MKVFKSSMLFLFILIPLIESADGRRIKNCFEVKDFSTADEIFKLIEENPSSISSKTLPSDKIRLVETNDQDENSNCMGYVMGVNKMVSMEEFLSFLLPSHEEVQADEAEAGDLVLYVKDGYILHVGIYLGDGWIRSKWFKGPVFDHLLEFVPQEWKGKILFYRIRLTKLNQRKVATPGDIFRWVALGRPFKDFKKKLPPGIKVLKDVSDDEMDCFGYLMGSNDLNAILDLLGNLTPDREVADPIRGDVVAYYDYEGIIVHVGIYMGDGKVISKWGIGGPVIEHDIDFVPPEWKDGGIKFYRIPSLTAKFKGNF